MADYTGNLTYLLFRRVKGRHSRACENEHSSVKLVESF